MQIRMLVRSPAGLPPSSRSRPIAPASRVARPTWSISSSRKRSTICLNTLEEPHLVTYLRDRVLRERARTTRAVAQSVEDTGRVAPQRGGALTYRRERLDHVVRQHPLAVETAPPSGSALVRHFRHGLGRREPLMDGKDVADLRRAGILPRLACGIGSGGTELVPDRFGGLEQSDRIPQALGHLGFAVETQHPLRAGQQRLRLREEVVAVAGVPAACDFAH